MRTAIVETYTRASFLIDLFRINNTYLEERREAHDKGDAVLEGQLINLLNQIKPKLLAADTALRDSTHKLVEKIDLYRREHLIALPLAKPWLKALFQPYHASLIRPLARLVQDEPPAAFLCYSQN